LDILIFYGFLTFAGILVAVGIFGERMVLAFAGLIVLMVGLSIAAEPLTEYRVQNVTKSFNNTMINSTNFENLTSAFATQTGSQYSIRQYPVVANFTQQVGYEQATLLNRSWSYGLVTSAVGVGLALLAFI
jgi:hypothetical protein